MSICATCKAEFPKRIDGYFNNTCDDCMFEVARGQVGPSRHQPPRPMKCQYGGAKHRWNHPKHEFVNWDRVTCRLCSVTWRQDYAQVQQERRDAEAARDPAPLPPLMMNSSTSMVTKTQQHEHMTVVWLERTAIGAAILIALWGIVATIIEVNS